MRHILTVSATTEGSSWTCTCGMVSTRRTLTWGQATRQAGTHERRTSAASASEVLDYYGLAKWLLVVVAMAIPFLVGYLYGAGPMVWVAIGEGVSCLAVVTDHLYTMANERLDVSDWSSVEEV